MGPPPDHRLANRRAYQQPRTDLADANRGVRQQPRTDASKANRGRNKTKQMYVCSYNTRTLNDGGLDTLIEEIDNIKWSIIGLAETKLKTSEITTCKNGHMLYASGNDTKKSNGVGFLIHKSLANSVTGYQGFNDRLAYITIQAKTKKIHFVQTYMPTSSHVDEEVQSIYDQIQQIYNNIPKRDSFFLTGDFNSKVGGLNTSHAAAVGKHTIGNSNHRGVMLADFCTLNNLIITNTLFQKKDNRLWTWLSPNKQHKNQIDFIITRQDERHLVSDSSCISRVDISDHRLIRAKVKLKPKYIAKEKITPKYDYSCLKDLQVVRSFQLSLSNRLKALSTSHDVDEAFSDITTSLLASAKENIPIKKKHVPEWMSNKTKDAILGKHLIRKNHGATSPQYKVAKSETKKLVKKDRLKQIDDEHSKLSRLPPDKQFYSAMKTIKQTPKTLSWGIKKVDGSLITNKYEILETWASFYETLYADLSNDPEYTVNCENECGIPPILKPELEFNLKNLKNDKATGTDNIPAELIKAGGEPVINSLLHLFNVILTTNKAPKASTNSLIVVLFKKGDRLNCKNYRPISLLSHIYKLFMMIIGNRIKNDIYPNIPSSQAAYQPKRGTIEQILSLQQVIEKSVEFNKPVHIVFIDFTKAFDSVDQRKVWQALDRTSINKQYINLLKAFYSNSEATIKTDIGLSRSIQILRGVKQGDVLAAILFILLLADVIRNTNMEISTGYTVGGVCISNLSYADDIAAMNDSIFELQRYVNSLTKHAAEVGLGINIGKTKSLTTDKSNPTMNIIINGTKLEQVINFDYLGFRISATGKSDAAITHRIAMGWVAFNKNKHLLTSKRIPQPAKTKIYETYVLPVLLYGLECASWTQISLKKLEVFQNHAMRFMTHHPLTDRVKVTTLRKQTSLPPIECMLKQRKLRLYGHTKRSTTGLSKVCLEGNIEGKRSRGRPLRRFNDDIKSWTNVSSVFDINMLTKNRDEWRNFCHEVSYSATGGGHD